jgi:hypothetical protein
MPPQKSESPLKKIANRVRGAVKQHASDPIDWGGGGLQLPPGILGGTMEVEECRFEFTPATAKRNAGEPRLRISFAVLTPEFHNDPRTGNEVKVRGRHHYEFFNICDTENNDGKRTTLEENVIRAMNALKKLAGEDAFGPDSDEEIMEEIAKHIENQKPPVCVRFDTSQGRVQTDAKGNPKLNPVTKQPYEPMVFVNWGERVTPIEGEPEGGVADNSKNGKPPAPTAPVAAAARVAPKTMARSAAAPAAAPAAASAPDPVPEGSGDDELIALAEQAQQEQDGAVEGEEAQKAMQNMATELGYSQEQIDSAQTWAELADLIRQAQEQAQQQAEGEGEAEAPAELAPPKVGDQRTYCPPGQVNPRTKKPVRQAVIVTSVNAVAKTCNVKDSASQRIIMDGKKPPKALAIPFDQLEA